MTPGTYVEKIPTYTAVQWDGTDESAAWIITAYGGAARRQGEDILVESAHVTTLERDLWVVANAEGNALGAMSAEVFARIYEPR